MMIANLRGLVSSMTSQLPRDTGAPDYANILATTRRHQAWIPKFVAAVESLGYTAEIDETYVPPGDHSTEYWFYAVRWRATTADGDPASCGIFVTDLYMDMDPMTLAKQITSNCLTDASAGHSWAVTPVTVETGAMAPAGVTRTAPSTAEKVAAASVPAATSSVVKLSPTQAAVINESAPTDTQQSFWDQLKSTAPATGGVYQDAPRNPLATIPTWAWLAGGAAALFLFMGRGKS
jgi:hypothetical protein